MRRICLISTIILAFILRFYQLGANPPSLDWDEASIGYNAYSLLKTGRDEYGKFLPVNLTSFGDFKPAAYVYLTMPTIAIFGLNEFAVRLPSAVVGVLTVLVTYLLSSELFSSQIFTSRRYQSSLSYHTKSPLRLRSGSLRRRDSHFKLPMRGLENKPTVASSFKFPVSSFKIPLLTSLFLAVSPWHIQFSRVAFEANLGLFWVVLGGWLFLLGLRKPRFLPLSLAAFTLSLYSYHSTRLFVPIFIFGLFWYQRGRLWRYKRWVTISFFLMIVLLIPLLRSLMIPEMSSRFQAVSQFRPDLTLRDEIKRQEYDRQNGDFLGVLLHNRRVTYVKSIFEGYLDHFDFSFLFIEGDQYVRHNAVGMGLLYLWSLPFILFGIVIVSQMKGLPRFVIFSWFFLAPVASAMTKGTPHAVRALLFLPIYQVFTAVGLVWVIQFLSTFTWDLIPTLRSTVRGVHSHTIGGGTPLRLNPRCSGVIFKMILIVPLIFNIFYYLNLYVIHTPIETSQAWQYGYKEVVGELKRRENRFSRIVVTNTYDQPYIYFLFYLPVDPSWYQKNWHGEISREFRAFDKYEFREIKWKEDSKRKNTLLIISPDDVEEKDVNPIDTIYFLNKTPAFYLIER